MTWNVFFKIVELRTKVVSVSTFTLASLSVYWAYGSVPWVLLMFLFLAVLAVDMGTTAFNTFFDYEHGVDAVQTNREDDKVLVHARIPSGYALVTAVALFAFAGALGLFLTLWKGWPVLALGTSSLLVAYLYSGGRRPISSTPWGEVFAGLFLGTVLWLVIAFVLAPEGTPRVAWEPEFWASQALLSVPSFLFIASILTVNNCCDREGDKASGRTTLSLLMGERANGLIVVLPVLAYLVTGVLAATGRTPLTLLAVAFVGILATIPIWRGMFERGFSHTTKGPNMGAVSKSFLLFTLLNVLGWLAGLLFK